MTMATIDASIVIVSMPAIFRGIGLNPLTPGNVTYLLWMIMGYLLVQSVLVVSLGRLGDMFGRVKIYNLGFVVFTAASVALSLDPLVGAHGALWLIGWRFVQAFGGAMLMSNSAAILTDAFPPGQRGMALGINQVAGISGQFVGLLLGGLLSAWDWRAVFWINVPFGAVRHRVGVQVAAGDRHHPQGADRLARQPHVRGRRGRPAGLDHLRHPPLRQPPDRLGQPDGLRRADPRRRAAGAVLLHRDLGEGPDVPAVAVPHPRVRGRQHRLAARRHRPRRPAVHAGDLAGRHLAAAARLRLHRHPAVGRHLHAAAHGRVPDRGAAVGHPVRPVRRPPVRHRRPAGRGVPASPA